MTTTGEPYLEDATGAKLFAFLLENNEVRQAVARSDDLHELIMRHIDTDAIQADIKRLETERCELDDHLDELDELRETRERLGDVCYDINTPREPRFPPR